MLNPAEVSAVLVTRGDQSLQEIYDSLEQAGISDIITFDNSQMEIDVATYGRYVGIEAADNEFIYFQDDDLVAPVADLLAAWRRCDGTGILANNRIDEEWPLIGIGSVFHRDLAETVFDEYLSLYGFDTDFCRHTCDVVFAYQWPYRRVVLGYRDLPWGSAPDASLYLLPGQNQIRRVARERVFAMLQPAETAQR